MNAIEHIHSHGRFSGKAGLHRIKALCDALENPQDKLKFIHIAGTNGKGSTATMIASVMEKAGYKTGLFTSPFLVKFNERIKINGQMISDSDLERLTEKVSKAEQNIKIPEGEKIGEFEFVTALAFLYFLEQKCDIVVLETGLGGSFDATNIIKKPEVSVITTISFDHMQVLGNTLSEIASTKAGIIKPNCKAVTASGQAREVIEVIKNVKPDIIEPEPVFQSKCDLKGGSFTFKNEQYKISMIGEHQIQNAQTALQTIFELKNIGWDIKENAIKQGLECAKISGRMEKIHEKPLILLDGGHNIDGVKSIASTVKTLLNDRKLHLIIGMVLDKDVKACTSILNELSNSITVTEPDNPRAMKAEELAKCFNKKVDICQNSYDAFAKALEVSKEDAVIICGSLYLIGEAESFFNSLT